LYCFEKVDLCVPCNVFKRGLSGNKTLGPLFHSLDSICETYFQAIEDSFYDHDYDFGTLFCTAFLITGSSKHLVVLNNYFLLEVFELKLVFVNSVFCLFVDRGK
jgi:hypothetical protein